MTQPQAEVAYVSVGARHQPDHHTPGQHQTLLRDAEPIPHAHQQD